jgi:hypothetical protein
MRNSNITIRIANSQYSIYDEIEVNSELWITNKELQDILRNKLKGTSLLGMPPRTRSKFVKEKICLSLGYPIPKIFIKTRPRFLGQNFDVYVQKSNNLQIWNEEISEDRRYVLIHVFEDEIKNVKVIDGKTLQKLDKTGTLTIKHQATFKRQKEAQLCLSGDTDDLKKYTLGEAERFVKSPTTIPSEYDLLPIQELFRRLSCLVGIEIRAVGSDQDRNRGTEIHKLACKQLGYDNYADNGQFPDVLNQLLEIKLQTSPTIDIGKENPSSLDVCRNISVGNYNIKNCDIRYAIFGGRIQKNTTLITELYLVSGKSFHKFFPAFQGNIVNRKIQIPLPLDFFTS